MLFSNRYLIKTTVPLFIQNILSITIGMIDTMMVASAGEAAVAGVSLVNSLDTMLVLIFTSISAGGAVVLSQQLGAKAADAARDAGKQMLYSTTIIAVAVSVTVLLLRKPLLSLLFGSAEADVLASAHSYFFFVAMSFPFLAIQGGCNVVFRVMGKNGPSTVVSLIANLINVGGNALLIMVFHMGAAGAAISTLISRFCAAAAMLVLIRNPKLPLHVNRFLHYRPDFKVIKSILRIGIPNGIENGMFNFGKLLTQSLISSMGTTVIAANAVASTLANFQYMPGTSISGTLIPVVGQCVGAHEPKQARYYSRLLTFATYLCLWVVVAGTFLLATPIISIYGLTAESEKLAFQMIAYHAACAAVVWPIAFTLPNSFRAASDVRFPLVVSLFSMWVFRVAGAYILSLECVSVLGLFTIPGLGLGAMGVWVAMTADWVFRATLFLIHYIRGKWLLRYTPVA